MRKFKVLDLFCGNGGAAIGLYNAGFHTIVGIDSKIQKYYAFDHIVADLNDDLPVDPADFDFIWASPPCQKFSVGTNCIKKEIKEEITSKYVDLIPRTRELIGEHPYYCIENVPQAPLKTTLFLTGPMVNLPFIQRKRAFETNFIIWQPPMERVPPEDFKNGHALSVTTSMCSTNHYYRRKRQGLSGRPRIQETKHAMGVPQNYNFTHKGIGNAVPPPYAEYIGRQVLKFLAA